MYATLLLDLKWRAQVRKGSSRRMEVRQHTLVPCAVAKVLLSLTGLVVYIKGDSIPGINTARTADILRQYPEHNTGSHTTQPQIAELTTLSLFGSLPHPTPLLTESGAGYNHGKCWPSHP